MTYWTWGQIKAKVESECDIQDESFISPEELLTYGNEAVDEAESEIHTLYEDYFLKFVDFPLAVGDEFFSIPTLMPDIYADKIREIIFKANNSTDTYEITRIRDWKKFKLKASSDAQATTDNLQYFIINMTPGNPQIMLVPKVWEAGSARAWYLRNANRFVVDTDICDIPEFVHFVIAFMKWKVYAKEGHPGTAEAFAALEKQRGNMTSTLSNRVPDNNDTIEADMSAYQDMN